MDKPTDPAIETIKRIAEKSPFRTETTTVFKDSRQMIVYVFPVDNLFDAACYERHVRKPDPRRAKPAPNQEQRPA